MKHILTELRLLVYRKAKVQVAADLHAPTLPAWPHRLQPAGAGAGTIAQQRRRNSLTHTTLRFSRDVRQMSTGCLTQVQPD